MNLLERAIASLAPSWAASRAASRAKLDGFRAMSRAYDGARRDRLYGNWHGGGDSADAALLQALPQLRQRCRDLNRNNPIAAAITNGIVRNVVGSGMRVQSLIDAEAAGVSVEEARKLGRIAEGLFWRWEQFAAADERTDFAGLQRLAQRKKTEDGEVFARGVLVDRPGRPFRTAIEVIEADRVQTPGSIDDDRQRYPRLRRRGARPVQGRSPTTSCCSTRATGTCAAARRSGSSGRSPRGTGRGAGRWSTLTWVKRPGQTRGEPRLAPVMTSLHDLGQVLEAERVAKRIEACLAGFIKRDPSTWTMSVGAKDPETGGMRVDFEPGMFEMLLPGESTDLVQSNRPGTTFDLYVERMVRCLGAVVECRRFGAARVSRDGSSWGSGRPRGAPRGASRAGSLLAPRLRLGRSGRSKARQRHGHAGGVRTTGGVVRARRTAAPVGGMAGLPGRSRNSGEFAAFDPQPCSPGGRARRVAAGCSESRVCSSASASLLCSRSRGLRGIRRPCARRSRNGRRRHRSRPGRLVSLVPAHQARSPQHAISALRASLSNWSGRRDSNSRHSAWEADALPTELRPREAGIVASGGRGVKRAGAGPDGRKPGGWGTLLRLARSQPANML